MPYDFKDKEVGETQAHEKGESLTFEGKENKGLVTDRADKTAKTLRKKALGKFLGAY